MEALLHPIFLDELEDLQLDALDLHLRVSGLGQRLTDCHLQLEHNHEEMQSGLRDHIDLLHYSLATEDWPRT